MNWRKRKTGKNVVETLECLKRLVDKHLKAAKIIMVPHGTLVEHLRSTKRLHHYALKLEKENKYLKFLADNRLQVIKEIGNAIKNNNNLR